MQANSTGMSCSAWRPMGATLVAALMACVIFYVPGLADLLSYNRERIMQGEFWRIVTSHWTHWTEAHLFWDLLAFSVLLFLSLRVHVLRTVCLLASASMIIPLGIWLLYPAMLEYRGLSGLDSALYVFVGLDLLRRCSAAGDISGMLLAGGVLIGLVGKVVFEMVTGENIFVVSMGLGVVGVPLAHTIGAVLGALFSSPFFGTLRSNREAMASGCSTSS